MAFEIRDLMIDVLPQRADRGGRGALWASCMDVTDIHDSECPEPSCAPDCQPKSDCGPVTRPGPPPPKPGSEERSAAPAGLFLLRQQLHQTLSRQL